MYINVFNLTYKLLCALINISYINELFKFAHNFFDFIYIYIMYVCFINFGYYLYFFYILFIFEVINWLDCQKLRHFWIKNVK